MSYHSKHRQQVHECGEPLCHQIVPVGKRYCAKHQAQHEAEWQAKKDTYRRSKLGQAIKAQQAKQYDQTKRDPAATAFYHSKQWQTIRDAVYARDGATCQVCGNVVQNRKIVDHVIARRLCSPQEALDSSNLWTLCAKCHFRKTKLEQIISQQPRGDTKLKHLDRQWWKKVLMEKKEDKSK
ncbi:HNH endonuclease signature motif containing protein [Lacticaseibacillus paracasei]|uniref:HNH endonuclease n=1 Tax=Lacticaseibacillus paracasei TaxID=1597 RepID=UPI00261BDE3F|nr:HNH endonuclease signature motif containing protein [Lacticaseibacillus paracasei]MDN4552957.1 HNH endonuclease signature motif containing protein [Lacticaseibacillus paracasei]